MTVQIAPTLQSVLRDANPNLIADALRHGRIDQALSPIKVAFVALTSATAHNITTLASRAAATTVGFTPALRADELLPAVGSLVSVRVTAGAAAAGLRQVGDAGATPSATVATLSDDGKTLTFEAGVTAFVLYYTPRASNLQSTFANTAP